MTQQPDPDGWVEPRYRFLFESHPLPMWVYDRETLALLAANDAAVAAYGYSRAELLSMTIADLRPPEDRKRLLSSVPAAPDLVRKVGVWHHQRKDGTLVEAEITLEDLVFGGRPARLVLASGASAERQARQLNRLYRTVREVDAVVVRADDSDALLREACRILVEHGCFRMAWVGFPEPGSGRVVPVARAGHGLAYLDSVEILSDESPLGQGPTGIAIRTGRHAVAAEIASDAAVEPWRERQLEHGFRSSAAFPLPRRGGVGGALTVYAAEAFTIGDDETALLDGLALDLGYALDALADRSERRAAEAALRRQHATLAGILQSTREPVFSVDLDGRYTTFNRAHADAMRAHYGCEIGAGASFLESIPLAADREAARRNLVRVLAGETFTVRYEAGDERHRRGTFEIAHTPIRDDDGRIAGATVFSRDVTERKRAEDRIRRHNRLLLTIREIDEAILRAAEVDGLLSEACRILVEQGGFRLAWIGFVDPASGRVVPSARAGEGSERLDDDGTGPDGVAFPIRRRGSVAGTLTVSPSPPHTIGEEETALLDELAADLGFAVEALHDREERRKADEALRESEGRMRSLFDGMLEGYAHCRMVVEDGVPVDWLYLDVNPAFERLTGLKGIVGKRVVEAIPGIRESNPGLFEAYGQVASTGMPRVFEEYVGPLRTWFSVSAYCPRPGDFVAVFDDVTERKRAEAELTKLSSAVEASPSAVVITDPEGTIEYVNPKFVAVSGFTREEALGRNPRLLKSGETPAQAYEELWRTIKAGGVWHGELRNRKKSGELFSELVSISSIRDASGAITHFVAVKEDITERKRAEEELARAQEQVRQAQKMEAVGRLAGGVAHDFNNLLMVIRGHGDLLAASFPDDPDRLQSLDEIVRAADRATDLTRQLLAFSRRQALETQVLDLRTVVSDAERMLRRLIGEDVALVVTAPGDATRVRADSGQLGQVLMNLVVNARDAMPKGGRLSIAVARERIEAPARSTFDVLPEGRYVSISVTDTGTGMDAETLSHVFEPFFTTKEKGKGTGLGLATVFGIVKQSAGFLDVASTPGQGTTFRVYLPEVDEAPAPALPAPSPAGHGGSETILLAEDEPAVRELTRRFLERQGYRVLAAANGADALAREEAYTDPIHLVLTDLVMPGQSGPELAREVVSRRPGTRVLLMSGYSHDVLARQGVSEDSVPFLQKPFAEDELLRRVREALDGPPPPVVEAGRAGA